ncbi:hypothetical protein QW71_27480 [Paenibacillus sp. IHB B 3415]|nr:hypothetical protein QW71_27480 [Paenibacillus sp. IHB B 3415]
MTGNQSNKWKKNNYFYIGWAKKYIREELNAFYPLRVDTEDKTGLLSGENPTASGERDWRGMEGTGAELEGSSRGTRGGTGGTGAERIRPGLTGRLPAGEY